MTFFQNDELDVYNQIILLKIVIFKLSWFLPPIQRRYLRLFFDLFDVAIFFHCEKHSRFPMTQHRLHRQLVDGEFLFFIPKCEKKEIAVKENQHRRLFPFLSLPPFLIQIKSGIR